MDRALDLEQLTAAVGLHPRLPAPQELQQILADAEIALFSRGEIVDDRLLETAWYLQAVATARPDLGLYDLPRQRLAHQISGHIFDLAVHNTDLSTTERLRYVFAAQVGYLGGELTPNAAALARRAGLPDSPFDWSEPGQMSLEAGIAVLALDRPQLYPLLRARRNQLAERSAQSGPLDETRLHAMNGVIHGAYQLTNYLTYGRPEALQRSQQFFRTAIGSITAAADVDSRWVAAHLLRISDDLARTSVWAVIPPSLSSAARAMTLGDPPVLSLWPPQLSFLAGDGNSPSPLDQAVKRIVLSFPTSAGKSLLAQLLITAQIAQTPGSVCVVAPTHSLCRELAQSLDRRLRTIGHQLYQDGPIGLTRPAPPSARVHIMTPEKLSARLRADPSALLSKYSMFVIDEAHLVADATRGWKLEETLSFLHHITRTSTHRIVVLSAALGNQIHFRQWLSTDDVAMHHNQDWRGPRRLNAIFTTDIDLNDRTETQTGRSLPRRSSPLRGVIHLNTGDLTVGRRFKEEIGTLVLRQTRKGEWKKDNKQTTKRRDQLVPLIHHVATSGPVLIVEATRTDTQLLAAAIASELPDRNTTFALADLAKIRLGEAHPLTTMLKKGVAFHHAALPIDIQAEIEDAVRSGIITILVATSTLTEGVNLPFKTVVIGKRGYNTIDGPVVLIDGPGLLNAIGRAGRAGRETEGWIILTEQAKFSPDMFDVLKRTGDDLDIQSALTSEEALTGLAAFESASRSSEDAAFRHQDPNADGFISYIWFIAQALQDLEQGPSWESIEEVLKSTLAWQQLDSDQKQIMLATAKASLETFNAAPANRRSRWARSGTSLPTAKALENITESILGRIRVTGIPTDPVATITAFIDHGVLELLLNLSENKRRGFKAARQAPRLDLLPVNISALLLDWVRGLELQTIADTHLASVTDEGYRYEQLAEFSASVFEHHLPWTLGLLITWVNQALTTEGQESLVLETLPGFIHYGVSTETALELMSSGIRSRRLANNVASSILIEPDGATTDLRIWLGQMSIEEWRTNFNASPTEIVDLLAYVRAPGTMVVSQILEGKSVTLPFETREPIDVPIIVEVRPAAGDTHPAPIAVYHEGNRIGLVSTTNQADLTLIQSIGIPITIHAEKNAGIARIVLALAPEPLDN